MSSSTKINFIINRIPTSEGLSKIEIISKEDPNNIRTVVIPSNPPILLPNPQFILIGQEIITKRYENSIPVKLEYQNELKSNVITRKSNNTYRPENKLQINPIPPPPDLNLKV